MLLTTSFKSLWKNPLLNFFKLPNYVTVQSQLVNETEIEN